MNINPIMHKGLFQKNSLKNVSAGNSLTGSQYGQFSKTDTITISQEAATQNMVRNLAQKITGEILDTQQSQRVEELRGLVASGQYFVSSGNIADAMLARFSWDE